MTLQEIKQEAEKEFDDLFPSTSGKGFADYFNTTTHKVLWTDDTPKEFEKCIKNLLSFQIDKAVAEALRSALPLRKDEVLGSEPSYTRGYSAGFNSCLSELKSKIKSLGIEII